MQIKIESAKVNPTGFIIKNTGEAEPLPIKMENNFSPSILKAIDTENIVLPEMISEPLGFAIVRPEPQVETVTEEPKKKEPTPAQIWSEILHEVAEEERIAERNKYLKVRKLEKTEPKVHLNSNFSIAGLKPENK